MTAPDPSIALLECLVVSGGVALASCRFALRRRSAEAVVDVGLTFYLVQYAAVGLAGMAGLLTWPVVAAAAVVMAVVLWCAGGGDRESLAVNFRPTLAAAVALFGVCFVAAFVWFSRFNPIPANDALTYHFPAAVQWLQTGRFSLLPTWFFNPSNTYSPLAGSIFIAWLMLPFHNDTLARFVEAPALLLVGVSLYAMARALNAERRTACVVAAAAILGRSFLNQMLLGKDDLFVDFFFLAGLLAAIPNRLSERRGAVRLGVAVGLLLATKYTALLALPVLALAVNRTWTLRRSTVSAAVAALLAGPWYLRNLWLTGNPVFPVALPLGFGRGLFTSAVSDRLRSTGEIFSVFTEGQGLPVVLIAAGVVAITILILRRRRDVLRDSLLRTVVVGPVLGVTLFLLAAPFPEARFVQPEFALGFVAIAVALTQIRASAIRDCIAAAVLVTSMLTTINWRSLDVTWQCTWQAMLATGVVMAIFWGLQRVPRIRLPLAGCGSLLLAGYTFVYWDAYAFDCADFRLIESSPWQAAYPSEAPLWRFVADHVPPAATLAYANTYLIYPLQGEYLSRRVVYAPTRRGVRTIADLPWLGARMSGEALVVAANRAAVADADRITWLANLRRVGADYLVVASGGAVGTPPEAGFAASDPAHFRRLFDSPGGTVYAIVW